MKRTAILLPFLWVVSAAADELPKNLLLKCEGELTIVLTKPTIDSVTPKKFETVLRLKDRELVDTDSMFLNTGNCELRNGVVFCTGKAIYASSIDNGSESREMKSYINRETGEYNFFMETTNHTGRNATGVSAGGKIPQWSGRAFRLRRNDNPAAIAFCSNQRRAGDEERGIIWTGSLCGPD